MTIKRKKSTAFTLIELSIVLVVIGLIVGGVLVGRDLIESATQRKIVTEVERFRSAAMTFKTKYNCLAGDCPNAYDYFGSVCGTNAVAISDPSSTGCNGTGSGTLNWVEGFRFWQHLSLAGLLAGRFSGIYANPIQAGVNIPATAKGGLTGYSAMHANGESDNGSFNWPPPGGYGGAKFNNKNIVLFGSVLSVWPVYTRGAGISPAAASMLDRKFDDGITDSGSIAATGGEVYSGGAWTWPTCNIGNAYDISNNSSDTCVLIFPMGL